MFDAILSFLQHNLLLFRRFFPPIFCFIFYFISYFLIPHDEFGVMHLEGEIIYQRNNKLNPYISNFIMLLSHRLCRTVRLFRIQQSLKLHITVSTKRKAWKNIYTNKHCYPAAGCEQSSMLETSCVSRVCPVGRWTLECDSHWNFRL